MASPYLYRSASLAVCFALGLAAAAALESAKAGDIQGDAYSCAELWRLRNETYKNRGYCFKTARAIAEFGKAGCLYDDVNAVPLSNQDRLVLRDIRRSERRQGCN